MVTLSLSRRASMASPAGQFAGIRSVMVPTE
jgi:hypothetical protein